MARVLDTARDSRVILGGLVLVHLIVISRQVDTGGGRSLLQQVVFEALSPGQRAAAAAVRGIGGAYDGYVDLRRVHERNRALEAQVADLERALQAREEDARAAARLRELLDLQHVLPVETIAAEVVAHDGVPWFRTLTIDKGRAAGVDLNAAVITPTGIVGRITAVGPRAARVQLLLDHSSGVGVLVERTRVMGVVSGQVPASGAGTTELVMSYVSSIADVKVDDVVVTSGLDHIFPKGLLVGRIVSVGPPTGLFREIRVAPSAHFDRIEEVLVLKRAPDAVSLPRSVRSDPAS